MSQPHHNIASSSPPPHTHTLTHTHTAPHRNPPNRTQTTCHFAADGKISIEDFIEYYHDLGSLIDDDVYFEWMMRSAWKFGSSSYISSNDKAFKGHNDHHSH